MKQKRKAVLITGATKRLGLAFTKQSLSMGYSVIAHYKTSATPLITWLKRHPAYKNNVYFLHADLHKDSASLVDSCSDFPVTLTGLINNASVFSEGNIYNPDHLKTILSINTAVPQMLSIHFSQKVRSGWIINITDANLSFNKKYQNYRFSKIVLTELTRQHALLFAPTIRVNAIAPGAILPPAHKDYAYFNLLKKRVPLKKNGDIESLLKAYTFLVENSCVTGQVLYIDNGLHLLNK